MIIIILNYLIIILNKNRNSKKKNYNSSSSRKKKKKVRKQRAVAQTISQHTVFMLALYLNNKINFSQISRSRKFLETRCKRNNFNRSPP